VASISALSAVTASRSGSILADLDRSSQQQYLKEQDSKDVPSAGNEGWRKKYQDILHFSILEAVRQEERKQGKMPV